MQRLDFDRVDFLERNSSSLLISRKLKKKRKRKVEELFTLVDNLLSPLFLVF